MAAFQPLYAKSTGMSAVGDAPRRGSPGDEERGEPARRRVRNERARGRAGPRRRRAWSPRARSASTCRGAGPSALTAVSATMAASADRLWRAQAPPSPSIGATVAPKPAASEAIDPGKTIQKLVQPLRKPSAGPYASRRYTYSPPERGNSPPSSPLLSAPASATAPPSSHVAEKRGRRPHVARDGAADEEDPRADDAADDDERRVEDAEARLLCHRARH